MDVPAPAPGQRVLGVTVPVPEPWASRVRLVRAEAGDPLARTIGPHITILPPTLVARDEVEAAERHVTAVASRTLPFVVELDGVDGFRPVSPVVYLSVARGAEDLDALQRAVRDEDGPLARELRFRFHPHVTLAHEVGPEALDAAAASGEAITAEFVADRLELRLLAEDGSWDLLRTVPLSGPVPGRAAPASPTSGDDGPSRT